MSTPWRWRLKGTSYFTEATVTLAKQNPTRASACCWRTEAIWDQGRSLIQQTFGSSRRWRTRSRDCEMLTLYMLTVWRTNDYVFFKDYRSHFENLKGTLLTKKDPHVVPNLNNFHTSEEQKILNFEKVENISKTTLLSKSAQSCRFALYNIRKIRPFLSEHATQLLVQALVLSRLDYCNALLAGLPASSIKPLQLIQNAAARLIFNEPKRTHLTPLLINLYWLPIAARIKFKALMFAYKTPLALHLFT